jgi:arginyl-tRNA--protein-N-Asp/Glu arginylyltransferase
VKIIFDHINGFGKVSDQDFIYSQPHGVLEPGETEADALANGWIPWDGDWYNLRSVRIDLSAYKPHETTRKLARLVDFMYEEFEDKLLYRHIYDLYCKHHGFERTITWQQLFTGDIISYSQLGQVIGYSAVEVYDTAFVATQFVWDYANPKLSLGKVAQMYECEVAKMLGCTHVYILGGYEKCCLYKSDFYGFEWWTGTEWSTDKELYKKLCLRDEAAIVTYDDSDLRTEQ